VFGVPLVTAVQRSRVSDKLPLCRVFQDSVMYIETFGKKTPNLPLTIV
jgi:hypothetical protein